MAQPSSAAGRLPCFATHSCSHVPRQRPRASLAPPGAPLPGLQVWRLRGIRSPFVPLPSRLEVGKDAAAGASSSCGTARRHPSAARALLDPAHAGASTAQSIHNVLSTLADAAADVTNAASAAADAATAAAAGAAGATEGAVEASASDGGNWFSGLANALEYVLKVLEQGLTALHVPYAYGFSIILLTVLVKAVTYPLTKQQVESTLAMQSLQPKLKSIQAKFAGDQERIQLETARLYKQAGINPLAGCLPTLATLPVWIGLYQALSNVAKEGALTEGFFWIPSLAGPASLAARDSGSGLSWLFNWVDGAPPLGWGDTAAYLVLPVLLVASQYYSMQILQPASMSDDPAQKNTQLILKFLPIMIGWFALSVPSGLSLYWLTNNVLSTAQTVYLRKMGGAQPVVTPERVVEIIDVGQAKRSGINIVNDEDRARAERFRRLKEMEAERKAARRAAEEAAKAAALQALKEKEREEVEQQQQQQQQVLKERQELEQQQQQQQQVMEAVSAGAESRIAGVAAEAHHAAAGAAGGAAGGAGAAGAAGRAGAAGAAEEEEEEQLHAQAAHDQATLKAPAAVPAAPAKVAAGPSRSSPRPSRRRSRRTRRTPSR